MMEKKPKIKKIKKTGRKISFSSMLYMGVSLFLTVGLFVGLVTLQSFLMEDITYQEIIVAKQNIPQNTIITQENVSQYLTVKAVNILEMTGGSLLNTDELIGQKAIVSLYAGEDVTLKDFERLSIYTENFAEPVEVSVKIADIADADGGKLRAGDLVNLTMMFTNEQLGLANSKKTDSGHSSTSLFESVESVVGENETADKSGEEKDASAAADEEKTAVITPTISSYQYETWAQYVMENLYISKVLDSAGVEIESTDTESTASILVFVIEKKNEADLNNALANCTSLRISKVVETPGAFVDISQE